MSINRWSQWQLIVKAAVLSALCISTYSMATTTSSVSPPKYIFYFIGDGMSFPQATALGIYRGTVDNQFIGTVKQPTPNNPPKALMPIFASFPVLGAATTYDASDFITDSAAAATALATGYKALDGGVGVDAFNHPHPSIATLLKQKNNYKVGIVTTVSLDHATPAGFYAHQTSRSKYYEIGLDLIKSDFDYFGGGGFKKPNGNEGNQPNIIDLAQQSGYHYIHSKADFEALTPQDGQKVLAVNAIFDNPDDAALDFLIDQQKDDLSLADYTKKGVELLMNDTGFFMLVEGGKIDWAAHANDAATLIHDVKSLEDAVQVALDFYQQHPDDTLIIVTGDHETGGFGIGFGATGYDTYFNVLSSQKISGAKYARDYVRHYRDKQVAFEQVLQDLEGLFGLYQMSSPKAQDNLRAVLSDREIAIIHKGYLESLVPYDKRPYRKTDSYIIEYSYYDQEPLQIAVTHVLNSKAGLGWTTTAHTGLPAAVYAKGVGQELFSGFYENTEIPKKIMSLTLAN
ncbi:alkaline phosphatase [Utexia brackfieldae]|uniref:alkaline phosphatase n=1 Tax=Utexia brackfieldae TaxID=3074108 RepID=UPI00370DC40C